MNRFVFAAIIALGLMLAAGGAAQAHGGGKGPIGILPGNVTLSASIGLNWSAIGVGRLNNYSGGYCPSGGYGYPMDYGYGYGYGAMPYHPYGYVYPAGYGY